MSDFDEKMMRKLKRLEREAERLQRWERPVVITDHGALTGLGDNDHPQYLLTTGKAADSDKLDGYDSADFGRPVFLTTPLTSTAWDGDTRSTTGKTKIDLSDVFGVPAGVKAVLARVAIRDSDAVTADCYLVLSPNSSSASGITTNCIPINDRYNRAAFIVPCDANGDIYYQVVASGADTMDVWLEIWGYWL